MTLVAIHTTSAAHTTIVQLLLIIRYSTVKLLACVKSFAGSLVAAEAFIDRKMTRRFNNEEGPKTILTYGRLFPISLFQSFGVQPCSALCVGILVVLISTPFTSMECP